MGSLPTLTVLPHKNVPPPGDPLSSVPPLFTSEPSDGGTKLKTTHKNNTKNNTKSNTKNNTKNNTTDSTKEQHQELQKRLQALFRGCCKSKCNRERTDQQ